MYKSFLRLLSILIIVIPLLVLVSLIVVSLTAVVLGIVMAIGDRNIPLLVQTCTLAAVIALVAVECHKALK